MLNRLALTVLNSILSNNTILKRINLNNLKLCLPPASLDCKESDLIYRLVHFLKTEVRNTLKSKLVRAFYSVSNR
jgi:hypothetical protein